MYRALIIRIGCRGKLYFKYKKESQSSTGSSAGPYISSFSRFRIEGGGGAEMNSADSTKP